MNHTRNLSLGFQIACTLVGLAALLYPFLGPHISQKFPLLQLHIMEQPGLITILVSACLLVLLYESQSQVNSLRMVSLLGILVAINSALRFIEVAVPGPGGFTPIFFLISLTGYVFGSQAGFLMGAMTLLVSAVLTGGIGPWLPAQMLTAGWVGMSAPACRMLVNLAGWYNSKGEQGLLVLFGAAWGIMYGLLMNLWTWPFITGPLDQYWTPGISFLDTIQRYTAFYLITSLVWDMGAVVGNVMLLSTLGMPVLKVLRRFRSRFLFTYTPFESNAPVVES